MLQHLPPVNRLLCEPCLEGWLPGCSPGPAEPSPPGSPWNLGVKLGSKCRTWSHLPGRILCPSTVIAPSMALSRSAAWLQGALSSPALVCPCPRAKGLIHSPAEPWDSSGSETQLLPNSMNQAPEHLSSHQHSGYLCFHLLPLLLLPSSLPAPLHRHFPVQNEYAKFPCTFVKHRGMECKDNGFSFLC